MSKVMVAAALALALAACGRKAEAAPDTGTGGLPAVKPPVAGATEPVIGINLALGGTSYFGQEAPFIDRFHTAGGWGAQDSGYREVKTPVPLDADGWPTALPPTAIRIQNSVGLDPIGSGQDRHFVLTWKGKGDVGVELVSPSSQGDHRITFEAGADRAAMMVTIGRIDPKDPVRDIHVVRADQEALFKQGEIFSPAFLDKIAAWRVLRFMEWQQTNASQIVHWSDRTAATAASWSNDVPLEIAIALAKKTGADLWLCVPTKADDDYVRRLLMLVRDTLPAKQRLFLEYSNEVWNTGFPQSGYAKDQAKAQLGSDDYMVWAGYRAAQIAKLTDEVFGAASKARVVNVLATQAAQPALADALADGVKRAKVGTIPQLFERYAIATYFGASITGSTPENQLKVLKWAGEGQAGVDAAMREIDRGGLLDDNADSLTRSVNTTMTIQAAIAQRLGLPITTYEAGLHITSFTYPEQRQPEVLAFLKKLIADPRMGDYYTRLAHGFGAAGGREMMVYSNAVEPSRFGVWGVLDTSYQKTSPRYEALKGAAAIAGKTITANAPSAPHQPQ